MQQRLDLQELEARFQVVRQSEYFPAILGAVAGGLTGAIMAGLIAGGRRSSAKGEEGGGTRQGVLLGFSPRDMLELATIAASLARQLREWQRA